MRRILFFAAPAFLLMTWTLDAGARNDLPAAVMLQPGKLLVSEDLKQPFGKEWFGNPGKWEVIDGVMHGSERTSDMHGAVRRREVKFPSAVVQFSFKLQGATAMSLSMNAEKGHVCRVRVTPSGFSVVRDKDKKKNEKAAILDSCTVKIAPNEWHTMIVEMHGKEMVAHLDGKHFAFGSHDGLNVPKANVGFTVAGESVAFKNLRVYEGTPLKTWEDTKAKLLASRKK